MELPSALEAMSNGLTGSLQDAEQDSDSMPSSDKPLYEWVDFDTEEAGDQWGSGQASITQPEFDPASAFEAASSAGDDSLTDRDLPAWDENASGSESKRQRLNSGRYKPSSVTGPQSRDVSPVQIGGSGLVKEFRNSQDDDDHSSGDFQGQDFEDNEEDVVKALGTENVRRLASMTDGELVDFEDSSSLSSPRAHGAASDSSSDISSEDSPQSTFCVNCTSTISPGQSECEDCGHKQELDDNLFSHTRPSFADDDSSDPNLTALAYDEIMLEHEEGKQTPHPERPDRIRAIIARLMATGLAERCRRIHCREATKAELATCHSREHIEAVAAKAEEAGVSGEEIGVPRVYYSQDTYVRPETFRCASLSAGGAIEAACTVARGECRNAAAIIRPPGHHAESSMAMGFCFFNNAAVAARAAQAAGAGKIMILDWDVHHGNGTQQIFEDDPSVLFVSLHRYDGGHFFPGSGGPNEVGSGAGIGKTVNVPWPTGGMGNGDYLAAFHHVVMPIAYEFGPDLVIISAGFDAANGDPLGGCRLTPECFAHMTAMLKSLAPCCALLEGGYNLEATAEGTEATLRVLMGESPHPVPGAARVSPMATHAIQTAISQQAPYWRCLRAFVEPYRFDPYSSVFQRLSDDYRSPRQIEPLSPRRSSLELVRSRSKLAAVRQQGKSQRKWALMHALHLVAVKHRMRASKEVSKSLARVNYIQDLSNGKLEHKALSLVHAKHSLAPASPLSPTKRSLMRLGSQHPESPQEDDPFMTQDSDTNEQNPFEVDRTLLSLAE